MHTIPDSYSPGAPLEEVASIRFMPLGELRTVMSDSKASRSGLQGLWILLFLVEALGFSV